MGWRPAICLLAAIALSPCATLAQTRPPLEGRNQHEINDNAATRLRLADQALNDVYGKLMTKASPQGRLRLVAAQRAWISFRDLDCEARAGSRGGSFHPAAKALCLESLTDERTRALQAELDCAEGDMACGGVVD
jgi:uncharacterized protein YecT (DUF1311 family)